MRAFSPTLTPRPTSLDSDPAELGGSRGSPGRSRVSLVSFAIMLGGWIAFGIALIASRQTLDDVWTAARDLPLVLEGAAWVLGFPFLVGLAIWHASWDEATRLVAIAALAVAYTFMFRPRKR
jgi:hypothetical protein